MRFSLWLGVVLCCGSVAAGAEEWKPLWNGRDFSGWEHWLGKADPSIEVPGEARAANGAYAEPIGAGRDPLRVFSVVEVDGRPAIRISGQIFGAIGTTREYSNYHLKLQFKWGEARWAPRATAVRDSGLLYHVHSAMNFNNRVWPRSLEVQIQERDVGDLFALGSQITVRARQPDPTRRLFIYDPAGRPTDFIERAPIGNRCIKDPDNEKPHGEWNTVELVCLGDSAIYIVNGKVVMRLSQARRLDGPEPARLDSGRIQLQSEGAEIFFRDIVLREIAAVPPEFVERSAN